MVVKLIISHRFTLQIGSINLHNKHMITTKGIWDDQWVG